jgi:hypothetical protein
MHARPTTEEAHVLALNALSFIVNSGETLDRFMALSGLDADTLRAAAAEPETHVAVLDFLLSDEPLLVDFCETASIDARTVHLARYVLGGP